MGAKGRGSDSERRHGMVTHPLQLLMSRNGAMPLRIVDQFLEEARPGQVLLDPFCGKGTSLLGGAIRGMKVYGGDVSPEAVLCSQAKVSALDAGRLVEYVKTIGYQNHVANPPGRVQTFFSPKTTAQLMSIRRDLLKDLDETGPTRELAVGATAALLGILHGRSQISLSIPSAHSYAMSPSYVQSYASKHGLRRPTRDVRSCLISKIEACFQDVPKAVGIVHQGSALDVATTFPNLKGKVDFVLTSPPYLSAQTYAKDNWLRLWFLGHDYRTLRPSYIETGSVEKYEQTMHNWLVSTADMMRPGGRLVVVAGDVRRRGSQDKERPPYKTGVALRRIAMKTGSYKLVEHHRHVVPTHSRNYHSLSNNNGHKRDLVERVFVAERL